MKYNLRKFQEGGAMPPQEPAPAGPEAGAAPGGAPAGAPAGPEGGAEGGDPLTQLLQMSMQALQSQDCQAAMAVCQALVQLAQQSQGAPQEQPAPEGEPVYRRGGKLARVIK